jgi:hypothetical protein
MSQKGGIRLITGLLLTMGAVGGMEQQPEASLLAQSLLALLGLGLMFWGTLAINQGTRETLDNLYRR